ncbi:unnamed protein product [Orchesella dallaii]|uniref:Isopenicillin N synthase-like Fe(2+) 2OG dioxygenase domain-containing protein n=1 Tax=Orchesella dallaii TaxID=48710 RepID=A0ABP1QFW6_9HEXA
MRKPSGAASFHGYAGLEMNCKLNEMAPNAANEVQIQGFKNAFDEFRTESVNLAEKLLCCIALYLGIVEDELVKRHTNMRDRNVRSQTNMRSSMYSHFESLTKKRKAIPEDPSIRCGEHCDWHTITLLFQDDIGGLEVKKLSGEWLAATPIQNTVLLMEIYSGGRLPATPHRVKIVDE